MRVVVDSSVLIDVLRGDPRPVDLLADHLNAGDEVWGVVVTRAEVLAGMRSAERRETTHLLQQPLWLEIDVELADRAAEFARQFGRSHPGIQLADCFIAAGTEKLGAQLLTTNVRHFPMIRDLQRPYPHQSGDAP